MILLRGFWLGSEQIRVEKLPHSLHSLRHWQVAGNNFLVRDNKMGQCKLRCVESFIIARKPFARWNGGLWLSVTVRLWGIDMKAANATNEMEGLVRVMCRDNATNFPKWIYLQEFLFFSHWKNCLPSRRKSEWVTFNSFNTYF